VALVIIDLKVGKFNHADVGQMNLYLNYALEHLTLPTENPPIGLILCSEHDRAAAHYALGNLLNKITTAEYCLSLPDPHQLEKEIAKTRLLLQNRQSCGKILKKKTKLNSKKLPKTKKQKGNP
jgi:hypothetical protein